MTGPEHYREAERLLSYLSDGHLAAAAMWGGDLVEARRRWLATAQVHATLALAAATDRLVSET